MIPRLSRAGYYASPPGGADSPRYIPDRMLCFELITAGGVYAPESGEAPLHGEGWVFVHQPGQHTVWRTEPGLHYECMTVSVEGVSWRERTAWPRMFRWEDAGQAVSFAHEVLYAFHHMRLDPAVLGGYVLGQFRFRLVQYQHGAREQLPPRLAAVLAYMEASYGEDLSIGDLAGQAGVSASHLHADFRRHLKQTPHQYLIAQRVNAARHALATTNAPIKEVARDTGYASTESFCRAFKRHTGLTAAEYRRKYWVRR